ncbi:hypothetical protein IMZ31_24275 (plasmid) [Pontibacillus sp. ALD_SL1]|uniref:hypothetical protein n=1 Tax=Pontibacillus sp. ALD_SL1 TaxID=2777185 RepID=UPI001A963F25|nr:hypothetical protein [Pontibacillus sp. ALD_SL1]QST02570.1 hypothetical protein IMZ31_24275 [Pontibacillus sp. ALD_SL1]
MAGQWIYRSYCSLGIAFLLQLVLFVLWLAFHGSLHEVEWSFYVGKMSVMNTILLLPIATASLIGTLIIHLLLKKKLKERVFQILFVSLSGITFLSFVLVTSMPITGVREFIITGALIITLGGGMVLSPFIKKKWVGISIILFPLMITLIHMMKWV